MELRIENARGTWRTVHSGSDKFYKALETAMWKADEWNTLAGKPDHSKYYPVALLGEERVFVLRISGSFAWVVSHPVGDEVYGQWTNIQTLVPAWEKPKREVSPETRERLAKNLEKARAARGKKWTER